MVGCSPTTVPRLQDRCSRTLDSPVSAANLAEPKEYSTKMPRSRMSRRLAPRERSMSFNIDRRTLLASSGLAGIALLAGSRSVFAQAKKELTIATSLPSLEFPFFVHMQKQLIAEGAALGGIKLINMDGQN